MMNQVTWNALWTAAVGSAAPGVASLVWNVVRSIRDRLMKLIIEANFAYGYATPDLRHWHSEPAPAGYNR